LGAIYCNSLGAEKIGHLIFIQQSILIIVFPLSKSQNYQFVEIHSLLGYN